MHAMLVHLQNVYLLLLDMYFDDLFFYFIVPNDPGYSDEPRRTRRRHRAPKRIFLIQAKTRPITTCEECEDKTTLAQTVLE